ncbi:MAG: lamin tail domain-containing protein, partial [Verrucomicrobiales bacterium]
MSLESPLAPRRIALIAILFCSIQALQAADSVVVFNEINYHPADELNETEWVELRSLMGVDVDMSGWSIDGGVEFVFPEGTVLPGHGYLLIAGDPSNASLAGTGAMGPLVGKLANGGESIRLENNNGRVMDEVSYGDDNDWPVGADGSGATLAKRDQASADARPGNWIASPELGGTPARANFPVAGEVPTTTQPILLGSDWSYRDTASPPAAGWQAKEFDDATWPSGDGVFYA